MIHFFKSFQGGWRGRGREIEREGDGGGPRERARGSERASELEREQLQQLGREREFIRNDTA
jgi:hypothetical protein